MAEELLRLEGVSKYYTSVQSVVMGLNNISLTSHRGEFVAITGESGGGKSTLAHVMSGILPYESGEMFLRGKPTSHYDSMDYERYRRDHISFISQNYGILPGCTVLENVVSALRLSGVGKASAIEKAESILQEVELWELRSRRAAKLSSGQKQRLAIARALAKPAAILIADEPTGNLDPENSAKIIDLLAKARRAAGHPHHPRVFRGRELRHSAHCYSGRSGGNRRSSAARCGAKIISYFARAEEKAEAQPLCCPTPAQRPARVVHPGAAVFLR